MTPLGLLRGTGSVREFASTPVDDATLAAVLDTARFAPSGGNQQPWRVAVVRDPSLRRTLGGAMQPVWDEYMAATREGQRAYNPISYRPPAEVTHAPNALLDAIEQIPVVLVIAADLRPLAIMDGDLERASIVGGASVYPFCWNLVLAARAHGLVGVMTTFLARAEPVVAPELGLPEHHGIAATVFLGHPASPPASRLRRHPVAAFATVDRFDGPAFDVAPTVTASPAERTPLPEEPPPFGDERAVLTAYLTHYRAVVRRKAEGLTEEQGRLAACPPSTLTVTGLVRHLAEVERAWFRRGVVDEGVPHLYVTEDDPDRDLHVGPEDSLAEALATWEAEIAAADRALSGRELDDPDLHEGSYSVRWILVHMIEEYARHAGHLDLLREAIDGTVDD
jgi:nitroreductase